MKKVSLLTAHCTVISFGSISMLFGVCVIFLQSSLTFVDLQEKSSEATLEKAKTDNMRPIEVSC